MEREESEGDKEKKSRDGWDWVWTGLCMYTMYRRIWRTQEWELGGGFCRFV